MASALNVVPLVNGQIAVQTYIKFFFAEVCGYVSHDRLVKTSCSHESVEPLVQFLLDRLVRFLLFSSSSSVISVVVCLWLFARHHSLSLHVGGCSVGVYLNI